MVFLSEAVNMSKNEVVAVVSQFCEYTQTTEL